MAANRVIGKEGKTPWQGKLQADMIFFKETTTGKVVVMGRKTYDSLSPKFKPLPDRENIVITRNRTLNAPGCIMFYGTNIDKFLELYKEDDVYIIGGVEIYKLFMPFANRLLVTHVDFTFMGDTVFPVINMKWKPRELLRHAVDEKNLYPFRIVEYTR